MKKFLDFEIVTIMVIAIDLGIFLGVYFAVPEFQAMANIEYTIMIKMVITFAIKIFILVNIVYAVIKIINLLNDYSNLRVYKKYEKKLGEIESINLDKYDFILGSFIYYRNLKIRSLIKIYKKYYIEKGYLINGYINENCVDKLSELENGLISMCTDKAKFNEYDAMSLEEKSVNILKEKKFLKQDTLHRRLKKFCDGKDEKYRYVNIERNPRIGILIFLFCVIPIIMCEIFGVPEGVIATLFILCLIMLNGNKITLSEEGKVERIKIMNLIDNLKKQERLSEKEKLFLDIMSQ